MVIAPWPINSAAAPLVSGARDRVAYPTTDDDRLLLASAPRHQHADKHADAERDSNGRVRMLADSLVSGLRGGDGFFLQAFANLFGLLGCGFQSGSKFALLAVSMFCCFHSLFPFLIHSRTTVGPQQQIGRA